MFNQESLNPCFLCAIFNINNVCKIYIFTKSTFCKEVTMPYAEIGAIFYHNIWFDRFIGGCFIFELEIYCASNIVSRYFKT